MPIKTREFVRLLEKNGFIKISQSGFHSKFVKEDKTVIVPMHARELPKGIEHSMRKQAGLK